MLNVSRGTFRVTGEAGQIPPKMIRRLPRVCRLTSRHLPTCHDKPSCRAARAGDSAGPSAGARGGSGRPAVSARSSRVGERPTPRRTPCPTSRGRPASWRPGRSERSHAGAAESRCTRAERCSTRSSSGEEARHGASRGWRRPPAIARSCDSPAAPGCRHRFRICWAWRSGCRSPGPRSICCSRPPAAAREPGCCRFPGGTPRPSTPRSWPTARTRAPCASARARTRTASRPSPVRWPAGWPAPTCASRWSPPGPRSVGALRPPPDHRTTSHARSRRPVRRRAAPTAGPAARRTDGPVPGTGLRPRPGGPGGRSTD